MGDEVEGNVKDNSREFPSTETRNTEGGADLKGKSRVLEMLNYKYGEATAVHKQLEMPAVKGKSKAAVDWGVTHHWAVTGAADTSQGKS